MTLVRCLWLGAVPLIGVLIAMQHAYSRDVELRIAGLHDLLSDTQRSALHLTREIGYGGLIHNFKNLVLRSDQPHYRDAALANADHAERLVDALEARAATSGVPFTLERTRIMVGAYRARLDQVQALRRQGVDTATIDRAVSFDDRYAIREIDELLAALSREVTARVRQIERQADTLNIVTVGATVVLATLVLALLLTRIQGRRHVRAMSTVNRQLESSNDGLLSANTALQQFAGMASHDLRTPLRHIGFFGDLVIEDSAEPQAVREHGAMIKDVVARMDCLIDSLLDFTQTGFAQPECSRVDVAELVSAVVQDHHDALRSSGARITLQLEGCVMADSELIRRALDNLLGNSLKYTEPDRTPQIEIVATPLADRVEFSVSDNGIGIEARFAERIFEPGKRLHGPQGRYAGNGIGLSLVKAVIEAHGGSVRLDTGYDQGSRFVFSLAAA